MPSTTVEIDELRSRRAFLRVSARFGSAGLAIFFAPALAIASPPKELSWGEVPPLVGAQLAQRVGYRRGDLLSRGDARGVLEQLEARGWKVDESEELLEKFLDDGHFLVRELRTPTGQRFARGVANDRLVFDRLDRLTGMPGGQQLIHDMMRLPDGQQLMSQRPTPGFTDLTILLPKQANGRTPRDRNFNQPTGKIYTEEGLLSALEERWKQRQP
jgi:hypothetical protein